MAWIEVNHQALRDAAAAIDDYCAKQDREMRRADSAVKSMLSSGWIGEDAREFGGKWEGVDAGDSTAVKFRDSLKNFSKALTASAAAYQYAQEEAYSAASRLPKYLYW